MAKRFTDTEIWDQDWFIALGKDYKLLWFWIKDRCDHAGIWKPETKVFEMVHDCHVDLKKAVHLFNSGKCRIRALSNGRWCIEGFIPFQYGPKINPNNRLHASILSLLEKNGVNLPSIRPQLEGNDTLKDKDKDKDSSKGVGVKPLGDRVPGKEDFETLWARYPRRLGKKEAARHFNATVKTMTDWLDIQNALDNYLAQIRKEGTAESYVLHGKTWFNNWADYVHYTGVTMPAVKAPAPKVREPEPQISEEERLEGIKVMNECLQNLGRGKAMPT